MPPAAHVGGVTTQRMPKHHVGPRARSHERRDLACERRRTMIEEQVGAANGRAGGSATTQRETDDETIAAIRAGDEFAYERLFRGYYSRLCRFAVRYVRDADLAEDVVQVVLGELWIRREDWRVQTTVAAYLYGATRNAAVTRLRQLERARRLAERVVEGLEHHQSPALTVIEVLEQREAYAALSQGIAALSDRRRTMLLLRIVH